MTHDPRLNPIKNPTADEIEVFSILRMLSKGLKYAIQAGLVIGGATHYMEVDRWLDILMASSTGMGLLAMGYSALKFKLKSTKWGKYIP